MNGNMKEYNYCKDYPEFIIDLIKLRCSEQDIEFNENDALMDLFGWEDTDEDFSFWVNINCGDLTPFYEKYPDKIFEYYFVFEITSLQDFDKFKQLAKQRNIGIRKCIPNTYSEYINGHQQLCYSYLSNCFRLTAKLLSKSDNYFIDMSEYLDTITFKEKQKEKNIVYKITEDWNDTKEQNDAWNVLRNLDKDGHIQINGESWEIQNLNTEFFFFYDNKFIMNYSENFDVNVHNKDYEIVTLKQLSDILSEKYYGTNYLKSEIEEVQNIIDDFIGLPKSYEKVYIKITDESEWYHFLEYIYKGQSTVDHNYIVNNNKCVIFSNDTYYIGNIVENVEIIPYHKYFPNYINDICIYTIVKNDKEKKIFLRYLDADNIDINRNYPYLLTKRKNDEFVYHHPISFLPSYDGWVYNFKTDKLMKELYFDINNKMVTDLAKKYIYENFDFSKKNTSVKQQNNTIKTIKLPRKTAEKKQFKFNLLNK